MATLISYIALFMLKKCRIALYTRVFLQYLPSLQLLDLVRPLERTPCPTQDKIVDRSALTIYPYSLAFSYFIVEK